MKTIYNPFTDEFDFVNEASDFSSDFLKLDQTTPQTITGGIPLLTGLTPSNDYDISTKKYVDDAISGLAGGHDAVTLDVNADTLLSLTDQELGLDTQTANRVWAGPVSGAAAVPTFRALVANDIPDLSGTYLTAETDPDFNAWLLATPPLYPGGWYDAVQNTIGLSGFDNDSGFITSFDDEKVKYDAGDSTAGYVADKIIAGTGISVAEGTGANENKLVVTSDITQYTDSDAIAAIQGDASWNASDWDTAYGWGDHAGLYDLTGSAATAETNAKSYADGLAVNYEAAGAIATHAALQNVHGLNITATKTLTVQDDVTITGALGSAAYADTGDFAAALGEDDNYVTDAEKTVIGNTSGTNTGDQTSLSGISDTMANFDTALSDGNFAYAGGAFHDGFSDFVANEHIDWTNASSALVTSEGITSGKKVYIGDTANAKNTLGLTINQAGNDDEIFSLKSSDISHGLTTVTETDTYGFIDKYDSAKGGMGIYGLSDGDVTGLALIGIIGSTDPLNPRGAVRMIGRKSNGTTGVADLAADETVLQMFNNTTDVFDVRGNGDVNSIGNITGSDLTSVDDIFCGDNLIFSSDNAIITFGTSSWGKINTVGGTLYLNYDYPKNAIHLGSSAGYAANRTNGSMAYLTNAGDPTPVVNYAQVFAKDVSTSAEMFVQDEAGNETQISPHDPETGEYIFYSENIYTGRKVRINMEQLVRAVEKLTGKTFLIEEFTSEKKKWEDREYPDGLSTKELNKLKAESPVRFVADAVGAK